MPPTLPKAQFEFSKTTYYVVGVLIGIALGISVKNFLDSLSTPVGAPRLPSRVTTYRLEPSETERLDTLVKERAERMREQAEKNVRSFLDEELKAPDAD